MQKKGCLYLGIDPGITKTAPGFMAGLHVAPWLIRPEIIAVVQWQGVEEAAEFLRIVRMGWYPKIIVAIEKQWWWGSDKNRGYAISSLVANYHCYLGICAALELQVKPITAKTWQSIMIPKTLFAGNTKARSLSRARRRWGKDIEQYIKAKKNHGAADALNIADFAARIYKPRRGK